MCCTASGTFLRGCISRMGLDRPNCERKRLTCPPPIKGQTCTGHRACNLLQRRSTLPGRVAACHAVEATARWLPQHDLSNHPRRRFPRPRIAVDRPRKPKTLIHTWSPLCPGAQLVSVSRRRLQPYIRTFARPQSTSVPDGICWLIPHHGQWPQGPVDKSGLINHGLTCLPPVTTFNISILRTPVCK